MNQPPTKTVRVMRAGRMAYHRASADAAYWDRHWEATLNEAHYADALQGRLGRFQDLFKHWLPKQGRVLEAGCGTGYYVSALRALGYDAEGVEWGGNTVEAARRIVPDLPIRQGDVTKLEVADATYAAYISLGVMEHREEGPGPFLDEAWRVLSPGGVALISVPHLHALRRLKGRLRVYAASPAGLPFYQYAYAASAFEREAGLAGFEVLHRQPYDGFKGIKDELPAVTPILKLLKKTRWTKTMLERSRLGHMMMYVCRKQKNTRLVDSGGVKRE